ncbi:MAG TPA: response regulator transcription factor [Chloroflexia bacterium]|nr:response regulator transcription factor [Chloroflexia bacterium]
MQRILLVDDEPAICEALRERFAREGFAVSTAASGAAALDLLLGRGQPPLAADCLVLDLMLPDLDGFEVLRQVRQAGADLPVILLTARTDDVDKIVGLELGADDYVVKPFNPRELVARVRVLMRRLAEVRSLRAALAGESPPPGPDAESGGALQIDRASRSVRFRGRPLELRPREFDLLALLAAHPGQVFTRELLLDRVWGQDKFFDARTVDVHIRRLREKLAAIDPAANLIQTERGIGYRLQP